MGKLGNSLLKKEQDYAALQFALLVLGKYSDLNFENVNHMH